MISSINKFINKIDIDKKEVLRYLEYKGQKINSELDNLIDICIEITRQSINPRYNLRVYTILKESNSKIHIGDSNLVLESKELYKLLNNCDECILISTTLGIDIEKEIRKYSYSELTKSIIIDSCATVAIETVCDEIQSSIKNELIKYNKYITDRYSPGYGDLSISFNKEIIELLDSYKEIGLTTTYSQIMTPRKSVVAIIGISKNEEKIIKITCTTCLNYENCKYRKGDFINGCKRIHKE